MCPLNPFVVSIGHVQWNFDIDNKTEKVVQMSWNMPKKGKSRAEKGELVFLKGPEKNLNGGKNVASLG